jgi:hypothetical protein
VEQNNSTEETREAETPSRESDHIFAHSIVLAALILAGAWVYTTRLKTGAGMRQASGVLVSEETSKKIQKSELEEKVLPSGGVVLPVRLGNLGAKMRSVGVIDGERFEQLYASRGGDGAELKNLLYGESNGNLKITSDNSGMILNFFWALGLGNKNDILESGPMTDSRYGGAGNFASTGGWTIAKGDAMNHYSRHPFIVLTPEQQKMVERVSKNIYRPCCDNSVYFPDCNHGMAMLGFLELMASQSVAEDEMYKAALQLNSFWFPDTYLTIAEYMKNKGVAWRDANPQEMLGKNYSSASGYRNIASQVVLPRQQGGSGCGVESGGAPAAPQRQQGGCGI